jgi:hypothetical protein
MPCPAGSPFPASISLIAVAQFGGRLSGPEKTANLAQTLDQLLKKSQHLVRKNRYLTAEIAFVRNNLVNSHIRGREVHTLDYLRVKAENSTAKIAVWLSYAIGSA